MARKTDAEILREQKYNLEKNGYVVHKDNEVRCMCCGKYKSVQQNNMYQSFSPYYNGVTANYKNHKTSEITEKTWTPICKTCMENILKNGEIENVIELLKLIDRPFLKTEWDATIEKNGKTITKPITLFGTYLKNVALNYVDLRFDDSDNYYIEVDEIIKDGEKEKEEDIEKLVKEWGKFDSEDLYFLEDEYYDWSHRYSVDTKGMEVLVKQICHQQLTIKKMREKGSSVNKELKDLQDLMNSSALKPIQESAAMSNEANTLGVWIKKIENEEPIKEVREEYKDVDGIGKLIRVFFLGHFCKMMGIKNELSEEYEIEMALNTVSLEDEDGGEEDVVE